MISSEKRERRRSRWEIRKNMVEITAILIGGAWALVVFGLKDYPAIALRNRAESTLKWAHKRDNRVHAEFNVTLTNSGSSPFTLTKAVLQCWRLNNVYTATDTTRYLDVAEIMRRCDTPFLTKKFVYVKREDSNYLGALFIQKYEEGAVWRENFDIAFEKRDTLSLALFTMRFYKNDCDTAFEWTYDWGPIGGDGPAESAK